MDYKNYLNDVYLEDFQLAQRLTNNFSMSPKHVMNMFKFNTAQRKAFTNGDYKNVKSINDKTVRTKAANHGPSIKITPRACNVIRGCRHSGWSWEDIGKLFNVHYTTPLKALQHYDKALEMTTM